MIAAFGLAATSQAQPNYDDQGYSGGYDYTAGDLVVRAPRHQERTWSGAPIVWARTTRVVDYSDLDLSTRWGVHRLHERVVRAAADACDELSNDWTIGLYDLDGNNADCINNAVGEAMSRAPITYVDYGY